MRSVKGAGASRKSLGGEQAIKDGKAPVTRIGEAAATICCPTFCSAWDAFLAGYADDAYSLHALFIQARVIRGCE